MRNDEENIGRLLMEYCERCGKPMVHHVVTNTWYHEHSDSFDCDDQKTVSKLSEDTEKTVQDIIDIFMESIDRGARCRFNENQLKALVEIQEWYEDIVYMGAKYVESKNTKIEENGDV